MRSSAMEISRLNDLAASHLLLHNQEDALGCYQEALTRLRILVSPTCRERQAYERLLDDDENGDAQCVSADMFSCHCEGTTFQKPSPNKHKRADDSFVDYATAGITPDCPFLVYSKALTFPSTEKNCNCSLDKKTQNVMLGVLLYNMGNAHHQLALKLGETSRFPRALRLYQLAYTAIENLSEEKGFDDDLTLLLCALFNNMGHIHSVFYEQQETRVCLEWLQSILHKEQFSTASICEEDFAFFFDYLLFTPEEIFCFAAAA